ncbi:energy transducer TonB [Alkaliflexus imshenetskii]|uniref:energy transducer TonB n=1 Tax=Alkaliflexus imshenetskii TaxID=286730 RepID=UPI00047E3A40|nr:energy transducer TonB [Alkaliflexus imshenetskii]
METRKTIKADLESKRSLFFQVGFILALSMTLIAFEWSSSQEAADIKFFGTEVDVPVEIIPVTVIEPAELPKPPRLISQLVITDEPIDVELPIEFINSELPEEGHFGLLAMAIEPEERDEVHYFVDEMPEFPGGEQALRRFLASAVKYPNEAIRNQVEGRVFVEFVVDAKGMVTRAKIARGVHPSLDREALRVVESMPAWKPGIQNGRRVSVSFTVPILFQLQN